MEREAVTFISPFDKPFSFGHLCVMDLDDQRFLEAAEGWLMLGNWIEANEELDRLPPERRA